MKGAGESVVHQERSRCETVATLGKRMDSDPCYLKAAEYRFGIQLLGLSSCDIRIFDLFVYFYLL